MLVVLTKFMSFSPEAPRPTVADADQGASVLIVKRKVTWYTAETSRDSAMAARKQHAKEQLRGRGERVKASHKASDEGKRQSRSGLVRVLLLSEEKTPRKKRTDVSCLQD